MRANYTIALETDLMLVIVDEHDPILPSITHSAADVISHLNETLGGLGSRRVYYRDSVNRFDEILHENGRFTGFAPATRSQQVYFSSLRT